MYQALYRKWRPQAFSDVCGQELITTALKNEIKNNRLSHAYLFTGCRGTGKTTCAKILAKAVNCLHPADGDPCNACDICRGIDDGTILDVTEIDAASNNGVDSIRDLRDEVAYTPVNGQYRVYIIDEVHMLSAGAFNALLKTLEEPPAHVIFVLATTEVHKLPATILSRCQRFDFGRIPPETIAARVQYVAGEEGLTVTEDAAMLLARLADGALRDALSLLDQCASGHTTIDAAVVAQATGMASREALVSLTDAVLRRDSTDALAQIDTLYRAAKDMERLCAEWIGFVRNLMILKSIPDGGDLIIAAPDELTQMKILAAGTGLPAILHIMDVLQRTLERLRTGVARRVEMEMAVLRLCEPSLDTGTDALLTRIDALERALRGGAIPAPAPIAQPAPTATAQPIPTPAETPATAPADDDTPPLPPDPEEPATAQPPVIPAAAAPTAETTDDAEVPFPQWGEVLDTLMKSCIPLYGVLAGSTAILKGEMLLICTDNAMFKELLAQDNNKKLLMDAIRQTTGKTYRMGLRRTVTVPKNENDPLTQLFSAARAASVPVKED